VALVCEPNLKVQMDLYHFQIVEGDVATKNPKVPAGLSHFQIAVPQRHEPNLGELNLHLPAGVRRRCVAGG
jgi:hydroxypyruvate isomerase